MPGEGCPGGGEGGPVSAPGRVLKDQHPLVPGPGRAVLQPAQAVVHVEAEVEVEEVAEVVVHVHRGVKLHHHHGLLQGQVAPPGPGPGGGEVAQLGRPGLQRRHVVQVGAEQGAVQLAAVQLQLARAEDVHLVLEVLCVDPLLQLGEVQRDVGGRAELQVVGAA